MRYFPHQNQIYNGAFHFLYNNNKNNIIISSNGNISNENLFDLIAQPISSSVIIDPLYGHEYDDTYISFKLKFNKIFPTHYQLSTPYFCTPPISWKLFGRNNSISDWVLINSKENQVDICPSVSDGPQCNQTTTKLFSRTFPRNSISSSREQMAHLLWYIIK